MFMNLIVNQFWRKSIPIACKLAIGLDFFEPRVLQLKLFPIEKTHFCAWLFLIMIFLLRILILLLKNMYRSTKHKVTQPFSLKESLARPTQQTFYFSSL